jgi:hypothetical protein
MTHWLAKIRIASALNRRRPLPPSLRAAIERSPELRLYVEEQISLDQALRGATHSDAPPTLHDDIMRVVRSKRENALPQTKAAWTNGFGRMQWAGAGFAVFLLLGLGVWLALPPGNPPPAVGESSPLLATAQQQTDPVTRVVTAAGVTPLTDEWTRLNRDLINAAEHLLASVP